MTAGAFSSIVGAGVYTVADSARFAQVPRQRIRRWVSGYSYAYKKDLRHSPAVWRRQHPDIGGEIALGFLDLMEIRALDRFVQQGVPWKILRAVAQKAIAELGVTHPFCTQRFRTDGHTIFLEYLRELDDYKLLDFLKGQHVFDSIIEPFLVDIDFDNDSNPRRWWPLGKKDSVFLDPECSFGAPLIAGCSVPTSSLYASYLAEDSAPAVASWWEVPIDAVLSAIRFEEKFAA